MVCGQYLEGFSVPGTTGTIEKAVARLPIEIVLQAVSNIAVKRLGLGIRHRHSSSKGTPTLIEMETGKRVKI